MTQSQDIWTGNEAPPVVFFDGVCGLCDRLVAWMLKKDRSEIFRFSPLQGQTAQGLRNKPEQGRMGSIVLKDEAGEHLRSTAVLRMLIRLGGPWRLMAVFYPVPVPVRDWLYDVVANNRYRWFGKKETCRMPNAGEKRRFLP
jgi:predicted DCC family thiol-disulfide oxidoreductase YuxK